MFTIDELTTIPLFSELGDKELEYLAGAVEDIHLTPGEYVAHEGEGRALAVVVEGKAELTKLVNGVEQVIGVRLARRTRRRSPDHARYAAAGQHAGRRAGARAEAELPRRSTPLRRWRRRFRQRSGPRRSSAWTCFGTPPRNRRGPAMVVIGPRVDPGVHTLRQLPSTAIRSPTSAWIRTIPVAIARTGGEAAVAAPLSGGGATRRHSADRPDDARRCHGLRTDGRAEPGTVRRGDRGRRARGSDCGGQRRLRGPADRADRVLRSGRSGRHLLPDRELHGIPIRRLRGRARQPGPATGEAAWR